MLDQQIAEFKEAWEKDRVNLVTPALEIERIDSSNILFFHTYAMLNADKYFLSMTDLQMYRRVLNNYGVLYNILKKKLEEKWCYLTMLQSIKRLQKAGMVKIYESSGRLVIFLTKEYIDEVLQWKGKLIL